MNFSQMDLLFDPNIEFNRENILSIQKMFSNSIKQTDKIADCKIFANMVVTGGNTLSNGFLDRMEDLARSLYDFKVPLFYC